MATSQQQQQHQSSERAHVRRLAVQLGISTSVLQLDNSNDNDNNSGSGDGDGDNRSSTSRSRSPRPAQQRGDIDSTTAATTTDTVHISRNRVDSTAAARLSSPYQQAHRRDTADGATEHDDGDSASKHMLELNDNDPDELEESLDQYEFDSTELPDSLALASDSNSLSASESASSELSLPRSFGRYDAVRAASRAARHAPFRSVSQFDDHLMHVPVGAAEPTLRVRTSGNGAGSGSGVSSTAVAPGSDAAAHALSTRTGAAFPHGRMLSLPPSAATPSSDVMKRFYEVQVEKVRSQLALATQTQRQLEQTLRDERTASTDSLARLESELAAEKRRAEHASAAAANELQSATKRLALEKTHFASLEISDALAEQLSRQDESDLSIREFVQLAVHRKVSTLARDLETARRDAEELVRASATYKADAAAANDEAAQMQRVADTATRRLQHELELAAAMRTELEQQVATLCAQNDALKDAQQQSSSATSTHAQLESELEALRAQLLESDAARCALQTDCAELQRSHTELEQRVTLLSADKQFLQDARAQLERHETALLIRQRELLAKVDALQATHERDVDAHARAQSETRDAFERKLETEVAKFVDTSARELERIRSSAHVVYERENRLLADARDAALQQVQLLQSKLERTQSAYDEKVLEATRMESSHSTALAGLRNDLKMKTFELSQLKLSLEEQLGNGRAGRLEVEMLEHKVQAHRDEFAKLEATSTARITQLEAALDVERSKLKEYEQLEADLDDAVLQTGALLDNSASSSDSNVNGANKHCKAAATAQLSEALTTFGAIPSSNKRRFQQSVALAQRVVKCQREALAWQQKLEVATIERRELERELTRLRTQLMHVHQPQSYLLDKLKRQEHELQQTQRAGEQAQQQLQALRSELTRVTDAKMALQRQLQDVLTRRGDLDALKASVQTLQQRLRVNAQLPPQDEQQHRTLSLQQRAPLGSGLSATKRHDAVDATHTPVLHVSHSSDKHDVTLGAEAVAAATSTPSKSPYLKVSPPPSIASKMTQAPWPSTHAAASERGVVDVSGTGGGSDMSGMSGSGPDSSSSNSGRAVHADASGYTSSPPRWYTQLRS